MKIGKLITLAALVSCFGLVGCPEKLVEPQRTNPNDPANIDFAIGVPVLRFPQDQFVGNQKEITFRWSMAKNAASYLFQIGTNANPSDTDPTPISVSDTVRTQTLSTDGAYFWRVRAKSAKGTVGQWSQETRVVRLDTQGPAAPDLISPSPDTASMDRTPNFVWQRLDDAAKYDLVVSRNQNLTGNIVLNKSDLTSNSYQVSNSEQLPDNSTLFWGVRARDVVGNVGPFSIGNEITIDNRSPDQPILFSPPDGATLNINNPKFDWSTVTDSSAVTYDLEIYDDDQYDKSNETPKTNTLPQFSKNNLNISEYTLQPSEGLPNPEFYFWRVRAKDAVGNVGKWANAWLVKIIP